MGAGATPPRRGGFFAHRLCGGAVCGLGAPAPSADLHLIGQLFPVGPDLAKDIPTLLAFANREEILLGLGESGAVASDTFASACMKGYRISD